jgi:hypothetical protein
MIGAMLAGWDEVWGIECETKYVEIAKKRIQAAREWQTMPNVWHQSHAG